MATVSGIEQQIAQAIYDYIYPQNSLGILKSIINQDVKICRGWPQEVELSEDLMSEAGISWITVNQQPDQTKNKTRYGRQWKPIDSNSSFGLSVNNVIDSLYKVEFIGSALQNGLAGVVIGEVSYPVIVTSAQSSETVSENIYNIIKKTYSDSIEISASTLSSSDLRITGFCGKNITMYQELSRLEETFCTSIFSPSIIERDNVENAVTISLLSSDLLSNPTFDRGAIFFKDRKIYDNNLNANLYRVDLLWTIEFSIISMASYPPMLWPSIDINKTSRIGIIDYEDSSNL
ncbi:MAG: hypothetical protein ABF856_14275 [Acetobacter aceti]|uniref:hypothetical protein n=1 Tax=Acetobacter aceti TaxID=435 RepID=UPI0011EA5A19|nr:hypothetical protein [Acetobacter aceti]